VCRLKGTERPFTGELCALKEPEIYSCVCCGQALFEAVTKFESGTGWPSFFAPVDPDAVTTESDESHGMLRTEAMCARCDCPSSILIREVRLARAYNEAPASGSLSPLVSVVKPTHTWQRDDFRLSGRSMCHGSDFGGVLR